MRAAAGHATDHPVYQECADSHTGGRDKVPTLCPPIATFEITVLRQLSVLVVEDHDFQREMIVAILQRLNAREIHSAADGQGALDVLAKNWIVGRLPDNYCSVRAYVSARSEHEAAENALSALDLLRGTWM